MNFEWRDITREDCVEFNRWCNIDELKVKTPASIKGVENLNKYLHSNSYGGLGNMVLMFINTIGGADDMYLKTATIDNKPVGFVLVNNDLKPMPTLECMIFAVNPELQGKGYGTAMLFDVVKHPDLIFNVENCKFVSYVNKTNVASQKAFTKVGFVKNNSWFKEFKNIITVPANEQFTFTKNGDEDERKI